MALLTDWNFNDVARILLFVGRRRVPRRQVFMIGGELEVGRPSPRPRN